MRPYYSNMRLAIKTSINTNERCPSAGHTKSLEVQVFEILQDLGVDNVKISVTGPVWVGDTQLTQEQMEAILLNPETTQNIINHD